MIYVIGNEDGYVKIGITSGSIQSRLRSIQTGSSTKLHVIRTWEPTGKNADRIGEETLHKQFGHYRVSGEWFDLPPEGIDWILACPKDHFDQKEVPAMRFKGASWGVKETCPIRVPTGVGAWLDKIAKETWLEKDSILDRLAKTTSDDLDTLLDIITRNRPVEHIKPDPDTAIVLSAVPRMSVDDVVEYSLDWAEGFWECDTDNSDPSCWWYGETSKTTDVWSTRMTEQMYYCLEWDEDGIFMEFGKSIDEINTELRNHYNSMHSDELE